jgi:microcystin-dependent protein
VVLQANQVAAHTHAVRAKEGAGNATTPSGNVWASVSDVKHYSATAPTLAMRTAAVGPGGGNGQAHDNVMPFFVVNFIICLNGYYPTRP